MTKDDKSVSALDGLKKIEEKRQKAILAKMLNQLKEDAKTILKLKKKTELRLQHFDFSEKDAKGIIDWINNLPAVKLTKYDEEELKSDIKNEFYRAESTVDEQMTRSNTWIGSSSVNVGLAQTTPYTTFACSDGNTTLNCADDELSVT